ncbi:hypothetical protein [Methanolobus profundi]|uniref:Uncharacterized protein n=1 Tax=Methanolobus profundi TaxID=487685 RepID=A0A1I4R517_9EURY|nr:hypothetical protein [Methanolobus profundi]SFM47245.1 hypothetical protein SAMN04488696_1361 [Methanolobus profundi]
MPKKEDFSWENGKIKEAGTLGKIVSIPTQEEELEKAENIRPKSDDLEDVVVDEFKEKMAEILSRELHKKRK